MLMFIKKINFNLNERCDLFGEARVVYWIGGGGGSESKMRIEPEDTGSLDLSLGEDILRVPVLNATTEELRKALQNRLKNFEITDDEEDNKRRMKKIFDNVRFIKTRCFQAVEVGEEDDDEHIPESVIIPGLEKFVGLLDEFLWVGKNGNYDPVFDAYRQADSLAEGLGKKDADERDYSGLVKKVRAKHSSLLSFGLMKRVNARVPEEKKFLYGPALKSHIAMQVGDLYGEDVLNLDEGVIKKKASLLEMDVVSMAFIERVRHRMRRRVMQAIPSTEAAEEIANGQPDSVSDQINERLVRFFTRDAQLMGRLRPSINDVGDRLLDNGVDEGEAYGALGGRELEEQRLREEVKEAYRAAERDNLTGLYNRAKWNEEIGCREKKRRKMDYTIIAFDFSGFKRFNDHTFYMKEIEDEDGNVIRTEKVKDHFLGDDVLVNLAAGLQAVLRDEDLLARVGGEEFKVLIPMYMEEKDVLVLLQRMDDALIEVSRKMKIQYRDTDKHKFIETDPDYEDLGYVRIGFTAGVSRSHSGREIEKVEKSADGISLESKKIVLGTERVDRPYNDRIAAALGIGFEEAVDEWGWGPEQKITDFIELEVNEEVFDEGRRIIRRKMAEGEDEFYEVYKVRYSMYARKYEVSYKKIKAEVVDEEIEEGG
jgi:GGDEF domain-containing protein